MNRALKAISITLAFVFSITAAAVAGALLAVWDTNNVQTAKTIVAEKRAEKTVVPEEKTQQVIKKDANIKDAVDGIIDKGAQVSGFDSIFLPDSDGADGDDMAGEAGGSVDVDSDGAGSAVGADSAGDSDGTDSAGDLTNEVNGSAGNKDKVRTLADALNDSENSDDEDVAEDVAEELEEPVEMTAEISHVPEIVRAGAIDTVMINRHTITAIDPVVASFNGMTTDPVESYPLPFTKVDTDYFADALFIGDSRMQGFGMYSKVNATFYAQTAFQLYKYKTFKVVQMPEGKVPIFDAMPYDAFTKIYIKVGLNEMGMSDEAFINDYTQFIADLRAMQPRAIIYIHAILPVTASKSNSHTVHNNENISRRNAVLKNFAEMMKCYYVDVGPYVSDETGALFADSAADGIHMSGKYMPKWVEGLCNQAVAWPR